MSKLVPNVINSARIFRGSAMVGTFEHNHQSILLSTPFMCFEVSKREPKGRFFADRAMIAHSGGPYFTQWFKTRLEAKTRELAHNHLLVKLGPIEAKDLFSYRTCPFSLELNHPTRSNPIALQIIQKAELFAIADEVLEALIAEIA